ncbi:hypothetical protein R1flu_005859 [Riccia fluitans]|uniref:DNA mismatch repair protein MLH3 n=1 Tax=Riccia fluitans TaxID=41844 RepID=A0ABD1YUL2_9MARC
MRQINQLSNAVVSRLRSGTIISDIAQIAEELVCNSIDAGATQIQTEVDVEACSLKVEDDGCGISRNDLTLVGERHATSKLHDLEELEGGVKTLGFRGEALSSLSDIALVEITSRCRGTANTYRKIIKNCSTISIGLCSQQRPHGTTVIVRDVFYNQPVRRRLMIASHRKVLSSLKERIVRLVLMHPNISFKVKDLARSEVSLLSKSTTSLGATISGMFGKDLLRSLQKIDFCQGSVRIAGYLSKKYHCFPSQNVQFIYINRRFVTKTPIHKLLTKWGQSSKSGPNNMLAVSTRRLKRAVGETGKQNGNSERNLLPVFLLNLTCPLSEYDITFEASKTMVEFKDWLPILNLVQGILQRMWGGSSESPKEGHELSRQADLQSKDIFQQASCRRDGRMSSKSVTATPVQGPSVQTGGLELALYSPLKKDKCRVGEITHHYSRRSRSRPMDPVSSADDGSGGGGRRGDFPSILSDPESIDSILPESASQCNDLTIPRLPWIVESCGVEKTPLKSVLSLGKSDLSLPWYQAPGSFSASDSFENLSLRLSPSSPSLPSRCLVGRIRASNGAQRAASPSLAEKYTFSTSSGSMLQQSLDVNCNPWFPKVRRTQPLTSFDGMELERLRTPSEVPDFSVGSLLWSGSDLSYKDVRSPDSSCFFQNVKSFTPNVLDVRKTLTWTLDGNDDGKDKYTLTEKPFGGDKIFEVDDISIGRFVCTGESFLLNKRRFEDASLTGKDGRRSSIVNSEASDAHNLSDNEEALSEPTVPRFVSNVDDSCTRDTGHQGESHGNSNSSRPRVKRKLEMFFSGQDYEAGSGTDNPETSRDELRSKCPRRSRSGPPFYQPPQRCGSHGNPPNSLSTKEKGSASLLRNTDSCRTRAGRGDATSAVRDKSAGQAQVERPEGPTEESLLRNTDSCRTRAGRGDGTSAVRDKSAGQAQVERPEGPTEESLNPPCSRNVQELYTDDSAEADDKEECCSTHFRGRDDTSAVIPVQLELPVLTGRGDNEGAPSSQAVGDMLKEWLNPCMKNDGGVLDLSSGILCWNSTSFLPDSIVKEHLQHARVLEQVDKKFIPAVSDGVLLMIDQHAADERVRLEELRERVLGSGQLKEAALLSSTLELIVAFTEQQMLQAYREQVESWGWRFRLSSGHSVNSVRGDSSVVGTCKVALSAVPCILGVMLTGEDLTEYLRQLMDTQGSSAPPPAVIRVLNYKACRGAIMFGDALLPAESKQLVEHLKQTSLCFQCAHGRPTMVPLVDLRALNKRLQSSDGSAENFRESELPSGSRTLNKSELHVNEWHGLRHRKSSLQRSLERLKQAKH